MGKSFGNKLTDILKLAWAFYTEIQAAGNTLGKSAQH